MTAGAGGYTAYLSKIKLWVRCVFKHLFMQNFVFLPLPILSDV